MTITIEQLDNITPEKYRPKTGRSIRRIFDSENDSVRILTPNSFPYQVTRHEMIGDEEPHGSFTSAMGNFELIYILSGHAQIHINRLPIGNERRGDDVITLDLYSGEYVLSPTNTCLFLNNKHDLSFLISSDKNSSNNQIGKKEINIDEELEYTIEKNKVFHTVEGKPWGREHILTPPSAPFMFKRLNILGNEGPSIQEHNQKVEFGYIEKGEVIYYEEKSDKVMRGYRQKSGDFSHLTPNTIHAYKGVARDSILLETSTPDFKGNDVIRHGDRYGRAGIEGHISNEHQ